MLDASFSAGFKFYADSVACDKVCCLWKMIFALFEVPFSESAKEHERNVEKIVSSFKNGTLEFNVSKSLSASAGTDATFYKEQFWIMVGPTNPDLALVKFINARPKSLSDAFRMLSECLVWRGCKARVAELMLRGDAAFPRKLLAKGQVYFRGYDFENRLIVRIQAGLHRKADQTSEEFHDFIVYTIECARLLIHKDSNACITILFDVADFSISNLDLGSMKFLITTLSLYYPESLGCCLIINYPITMFGIYKIIQSFLDSNMQKKIKFIKPKELEKYIPKKYIPVKYGGSDENEYHFVPPVSHVEKDALECDAEFSIIRNTVIENVTQETTAALRSPSCVGSLSNSKRVEDLAKLKMIGTEYLFKAFPDTQYHRNGVLTDHGKTVD